MIKYTDIEDAATKLAEEEDEKKKKGSRIRTDEQLFYEKDEIKKEAQLCRALGEGVSHG